MKKYKYVSLFSGGGIGDIGFKNAGYIPIVMNELEENRAEIIKNNYPGFLCGGWRYSNTFGRDI